MIVYIKTMSKKPTKCKNCPCYTNSRRCPILWRETNPYDIPDDCPLGEIGWLPHVSFLKRAFYNRRKD